MTVLNDIQMHLIPLIKAISQRLLLTQASCMLARIYWMSCLPVKPV